jgi:hypothetical protein
MISIFFQQNACGHSPYVTSSLTRGWVCRLQLLLVLASAVILRSIPTRLTTIFYCLRFGTLPTWRARSRYLYPPGTGWPSYTPRHLVPFPSPPTTCRATVGVFEPASTRGPEIFRNSLLTSQKTQLLHYKNSSLIMLSEILDFYERATRERREHSMG